MRPPVGDYLLLAVVQRRVALRHGDGDRQPPASVREGCDVVCGAPGARGLRATRAFVEAARLEKDAERQIVLLEERNHLASGVRTQECVYVHVCVD